MKRTKLAIIVAVNLICVVCLMYIVCADIQLRWRLSYWLFAIAACSGLSFIFSHRPGLKIYGFSWIAFTMIGLILCSLMHQTILCETDRYIMKTPGDIIGFDSAVLYEKQGIREVELYRYKYVVPVSFTPLDSIGAVVVNGNFDDGNGGYSTETAILPMNNKYFDNQEQIAEYARMHNIQIERIKE